ncbi:MAG: hypothetical protein WC841_05670 [Candidatus Shapirobacteria bacterium]|jgi:hypothetical protein
MPKRVEGQPDSGAKEPAASSRVDLSPLIDRKEDGFLSRVSDQMKLQGNEDGEDRHRDPIIRKFYRGALKAIFAPGQKFSTMLSEIHAHRSEMDETHMVNLFFRAIQYTRRHNNDCAYMTYEEDDWAKYFSGTGLADIDTIKQTMKEKNTATNIPARYIGLAAALRLITAGNPNIRLGVGDVGCSLGLGLPASIHPDYLSKLQFADGTDGQQIQAALSLPIAELYRAIGIDIDLPDVEWVKACNYPSQYDTDGAAIDKTIAELSEVSRTVDIKQADITSPESVEILTGGGPALHVIHSSLTMYELTLEQQQAALDNIAKALRVGGIYLEFTFVDPKNWFKGFHALARYKTPSGQLSESLEWLVWGDSRCRQVDRGTDFAQVNEYLANMGRNHNL